MIQLQDIDESNYERVLALTIDDKDKVYVAPVVRSLADAWIYRANGDVFPKAIYDGERLIGFLLLEIDDEEQTYLIWRLMIDKSNQGLGYGRATITAVIDQAKQAGYRSIRADYVKGNHKMARILENLGFQVTGQDDREIWTNLIIR